MQALGSKVLFEYSHLAARDIPVPIAQAVFYASTLCAGKVSNIARTKVCTVWKGRLAPSWKLSKSMAKTRVRSWWSLSGESINREAVWKIHRLESLSTPLCQNGRRLRDAFGISNTEKTANSGELRTSGEKEEMCARRNWYRRRTCLSKMWSRTRSDLLPWRSLVRTRDQSERVFWYAPSKCRRQNARWLLGQSWLARFAPTPRCARTAEGDEISKWFPKYQLCDSSDMHTGRSWGTSREDYPFPTTLKRSLGKESSSPRSCTTGFCTKLVKKSAQAHPF